MGCFTSYAIRFFYNCFYAFLGLTIAGTAQVRNLIFMLYGNCIIKAKMRISTPGYRIT